MGVDKLCSRVYAIDWGSRYGLMESASTFTKTAGRRVLVSHVDINESRGPSPEMTRFESCLLQRPRPSSV